MDEVERYDVIMLGTGFTECILANFFCMECKKVLILDKERISGGANGSIADLESLQQKFSMSLPRKDGEWNVDLIPKVFFGKNGIVELLNFVGVNIDIEPIHSATLWQTNALCSVPSSIQQVEALKIPEGDKVAYKELIYLSKQRTSSVQNNDSDEEAEDYLDKRKVTLKTKEILLHGMLEDQSGKTLSEFLTDEKLITPSGGYRSCFKTVPGREVEKRRDTHVLVLGSDHWVSPEGLFGVYASTVAESEDAESEIRKSLNFLTNVRTLSVYVTLHSPIRYEAGQKILKTSSCDYSMMSSMTCSGCTGSLWAKCWHFNLRVKHRADMSIQQICPICQSTYILISIFEVGDF